MNTIRQSKMIEELIKRGVLTPEPEASEAGTPKTESLQESEALGDGGEEVEPDELSEEDDGDTTPELDHVDSGANEDP